MSWPPELENTRVYLFTLLVTAFTWLYFNSESRKLRHIPSVGYSSPFLSYVSAVKFLFYGNDMMQEGINRFVGCPFKVPQLDRWMVIVSGEKYIDELKKAPDDALSFMEALEESLQIPYTMGKAMSINPYHIPIVRSQLTRNLGNIFPELHDEIMDSCNQLIPPSEEWKPFHAMNTIIEIVCRTTNRTFVGLPLCRNQEYLEICKAFTLDVVSVSSAMNMLPPYLRPLSSYVLRTATSRVEKCMKYMEPVIATHREKKAAGEDMPMDFLSWLLDEAEGEEHSLERLTRRILTVNFAAIHTTTLSFLHVLYNLAAYPEYVPVFRQEVEEIISEEGWSKSSIDKMTKIDSFLRETQRLTPLGLITSTRKVVKDYTFKDGPLLPKGTFVSVAIAPSHHNETTFPNPKAFDGLRFTKSSQKGAGQSVVTLNNDFLAFGMGRHGCPGRFFAANEMKLLLVHIVMNYDVKLASSERPKDSYFNSARLPDMKAEVMFRKRST